MVAAVIVLYKPDMLLLDRLLRSVVGQVAKSFVIDNTPESTANFSSFFDQYQANISYISLGENKGIATAQNIGIRMSIDGGCSHVLLLDQDSALSEDMVKHLLEGEGELLRAGKKIAAVGPVFVEQKTGIPSHAIRHSFLWVKRVQIDLSSTQQYESDYIISSGALIRTSVFTQLGTLLDGLFIDWVDIEWGLRARRLGYKCFIISKAVLKHSLGDTVIRIPRRDVNLHNDTRHYYIVRNATYLLRLHTMGLRWRTLTALKLPQYIVFYSWHSQRRATSVRLLLGAFWDGICGKLGRVD